MAVRINRKISHPAATNNILKIKRRPYHDTAVVSDRLAVWKSSLWSFAATVFQSPL
jgi:hypothetical protein